MEPKKLVFDLKHPGRQILVNEAIDPFFILYLWEAQERTNSVTTNSVTVPNYLLFPEIFFQHTFL